MEQKINLALKINNTPTLTLSPQGRGKNTQRTAQGRMAEDAEKSKLKADSCQPLDRELWAERLTAFIEK
jgi:hypothetical protein